MGLMRRTLVLLVCAITLASMPAMAQVPPAAGTSIEVREGDTWSSATVVRREGRRTLVRYDDGTEEWIAPDRLRGGSGPASPARAPAAIAAPEAPVDQAPVALRLENIPEARRIPGSVGRIATTAPSPDFVNLQANVDTPKSMLACFDTPDTIVIAPNNPFNEKADVVLVDMVKGAMLGSHSIAAKGHEYLGALNDGELLLTSSRERGNGALHLWQRRDGSYEARTSLLLLNKHADWGALVSEDRAIIGMFGGECYLVDFKFKRAIAYLKTSNVTRPVVHPSGKMVAALKDNKAVLIRTTDLSIFAEFPDAGVVGNVSVDPSGQFCAYPTATGGARIVKIAGGTQVGFIPGITRKRERLDLLGPDSLLVESRLLYDVKTGVPLWNYYAPSGSVALPLANGQMLYALRTGNAASLVAITLPHAAASEALKTPAADAFVLKPGTPISISGDLSGYGKDEPAARSAIENAIKSAGHRVATGNQPYRLMVSIVPGPSKDMQFREPGPFFRGPPPIRTVKGPSTIVTFTLTHQEKTIWEQVYTYSAQVMVFRQGSQTLEQAVVDAARPSAQRLVGLAIPGYLAKGSTKSAPAALGASSITGDGLGSPPQKPEPITPKEEEPPVQTINGQTA